MTVSIAFIGAGPTTRYSLAALLDRVRDGVAVTVFEDQAAVGLGTPYRPGWNDPAMLCNIASIEIPPLTETLLAWLERQTASSLAAMGVEPGDMHERGFIPRVALGRYFGDQFARLVERARRRGVRVNLRTRTRVSDVAHVDEGVLLTIAPRRGFVDRMLFDHAVLATGHQWPTEQQVRPGYFLSPWPASGLAAIPPIQIGIRGSSLTAIDAAVAVANLHGTFVRNDRGLSYTPHAGTEAFAITMMSRKGLLPEADFYFPLPGEPLEICTRDAVERAIERGGDLLEETFELFRREMMRLDPAYAQATGLAAATLEVFHDRYFAARAEADPFVWAEANLLEAKRNHAARITVPWRYAILRMHEIVGMIVPHLDAQQFDRFNRFFKPIFVDDYGAVPHESIERLLALHWAGKLDVLALGETYRIDAHRPEGGAVVHRDSAQRHFPVFIEATGQRPLEAIQFPFLSLLEQGVVRDEPNVDGDAARGISVDDAFRPIVDGMPLDRLFCLGIPFLMGKHPFVQGITSSHEMGEIVGEALARAVHGKLAPSRAGAPEAA
ncbi:MAG: FAD-dependent oxidoreductase [Caulobacterales bacterium 68-7]|nr:MAG: FAD-dependent oxidoreductase [Caulobacterales bacterium 68-7]